MVGQALHIHILQMTRIARRLLRHVVAAIQRRCRAHHTSCISNQSSGRQRWRLDRCACSAGVQPGSDKQAHSRSSSAPVQLHTHSHQPPYMCIAAVGGGVLAICGNPDHRQLWCAIVKCVHCVAPSCVLTVGACMQVDAQSMTPCSGALATFLCTDILLQLSSHHEGNTPSLLGQAYS
jgi:hypothetical protein